MSLLTKPGGTYWRSSLFAGFALDVDPVLGLAGFTLQGFTLNVGPTLSMAGVGNSVGAFTLAVGPSLTVAGNAGGAAAFGLNIGPAITMSAAAQYAAAFALPIGPSVSMSGGTAGSVYVNVGPVFGMTGVGNSLGAFTLAVGPALSMGVSVPETVGLNIGPAISMTAAPKAAFTIAVGPSLGVTAVPAETIGLNIGPALSMAGVGNSVGAFTLAIGPALSMSAAAKVPATIGVDVGPALTMSAHSNYATTITLAVGPFLSATAAARVPATIGLDVTPALTMAAHESVAGAFTLAVVPAITMSGVAAGIYEGFALRVGAISQTTSQSVSSPVLTTAYTLALAWVTVASSLGTPTISGVTFGGTAMTQVGSRIDYNNGTSKGGLYLFKYSVPTGLPTGSQSVVATPDANRWTGLVVMLFGNYAGGAITVGTPTTNYGSSNNPVSPSFTNVAGQLVVKALATYNKTFGGGGTYFTESGSFASLEADAGSAATGDTLSASADWSAMNVILS